MGTPRQVGIEWFVVRDVDDNYAPPEKPVLRVSLIGGDLVSIAICEQSEGNGGWTIKEKAQIVVDAEPLFAGLNAAIQSRRTKHDGSSASSEQGERSPR